MRTQLKRRQFLHTTIQASLGAMLATPVIRSAVGADRTREELERLFESDDPTLIRLAVDVMHNCVLAKIKPPEGTAKRRWLQAGTGDAFRTTGTSRNGGTPGSPPTRITWCPA